MAVVFGPCCFCGKSIEEHAPEENAPDPCRITVETAGGKWQVWFCHAACFRERLSNSPDLPLGFLDPAHF
jgi:hypothetical protein